MCLKSQWEKILRGNGSLETSHRLNGPWNLSTINNSNWWFPEIGVPPNHPFIDGFSLIDQPCWSILGIPHGYGTPQTAIDNRKIHRSMDCFMDYLWWFKFNLLSEWPPKLWPMNISTNISAVTLAVVPDVPRRPGARCLHMAAFCSKKNLWFAIQDVGNIWKKNMENMEHIWKNVENSDVFEV